jgi:hypothetical protein
MKDSAAALMVALKVLVKENAHQVDQTLPAFARQDGAALTAVNLLVITYAAYMVT